jgi:hypothetical protein
VNGQRETANAFLVNGGDVSEGRNLGAGLVPNLDSVAEFRLITNSFDAEYGKFSGAVMNAVTKSGTNGIHGTAFEFLRNDKFDANNFFDNQAPPGPDGKAPRAELRRNQFGYAIGGPFLKNRLFWFTDYQGTRQVAGASTGLVQLPTLDQRSGKFSPADLSGTIDGPYWAQVLTQRLGYSVTNGEKYSFAGCTLTSDCVFPGGVIPQRAFSKPAIGTLPFIPVGNIDPNTGLFADAGQKNRVQDDKAAQRVNFVNEMTGNWSWYYHFDDSNVFNALPNASVPGFPSFTPSRAQQIVMSNTKTLGPTAVNEARVSFFRTATRTDKPKGSFATRAVEVDGVDARLRGDAGSQADFAARRRSGQCGSLHAAHGDGRHRPDYVLNRVRALLGERYLSDAKRLEGLQYPELSRQQLLPYLLDLDLLFPAEHLHPKQCQLQLQLIPGQHGAQSRRYDIPDGVHVLKSAG